MPTPLGHALGGFAVGWLVAGPAGRDERRGARPEPSPDAQTGTVGDGRSRAVDTRLPRRHSWLRGVPPRALAFAALGMAADLDLLVGRHSQFTHSIGMTLAVGVAAFAWLRLRGGRRLQAVLTFAVAAGAAYGSHVLLDWLAQDATPPRGITALWPFSGAYYLSGFDLFHGISRQPWRPGAAWHDVLAVMREVLLLGPLALGAWWLRRPAPRQILPPAAKRRVQRLHPGSRLPADGESR